jgi:molybdate transport system regulatory protein
MEAISHGHDLHAAGKIWIEKDGVKFFGPGPYELLKCIAESGSLHIAATTMGISYRKAWVIVDRLNKVMDKPMVITQKGGSRGGGSSLSPDALALMEKYRRLARSFAAFLEDSSTLMD